MKKDNILSFVFGYKKSDFEINNDEFEKISKEDDSDPETTILDLDSFIEKHSQDPVSTEDESIYNDFLTTIFFEANEKSDLEIYDLWYIGFQTLDSYNTLLNEDTNVKRGFLRFLVKSIDQKRSVRTAYFKSKESYEIPNSFKLQLINLIVKSKVSLDEDDLITLLNFWNNSHFFEPDLKPILRQLQNFVRNNPLSNELATFLEYFLKSQSITYLDVTNYMHTESIINRILLGINNPIFLLLPGHFGSFVNQKVKEFDSETKHYFSKILKALCQEALDDENTQKTIRNAIDIIGKETWNQLTIELLNRGMNFITSYITLQHKHFGSIDKRYITPKPMHKENLKILNGLIIYSGTYKNYQSISYILNILERSFLSLNTYGYGPTSRTLGKTCIHVLANHFGEEGREILLNLYYETKFKTIKKQIELESERLVAPTKRPLV